MCHHWRTDLTLLPQERTSDDNRQGDGIEQSQKNSIAVCVQPGIDVLMYNSPELTPIKLDFIRWSFTGQTTSGQFSDVVSHNRLARGPLNMDPSSRN
jgi:hypothetical protein